MTKGGALNAQTSVHTLHSRPARLAPVCSAIRANRVADCEGVHLAGAFAESERNVSIRTTYSSSYVHPPL